MARRRLLLIRTTTRLASSLDVLGRSFQASADRTLSLAERAGHRSGTAARPAGMAHRLAIPRHELSPIRKGVAPRPARLVLYGAGWTG